MIEPINMTWLGPTHHIRCLQYIHMVVYVKCVTSEALPYYVMHLTHHSVQPKQKHMLEILHRLSQYNLSDIMYRASEATCELVVNHFANCQDRTLVPATHGGLLHSRQRQQMDGERSWSLIRERKWVKADSPPSLLCCSCLAT